MYSRSLDPRRIPSALPNHYGGSAFRQDGTPTPIPVRREQSGHREPPRREEEDGAENTLLAEEEQDLSAESLPAEEVSTAETVDASRGPERESDRKEDDAPRGEDHSPSGDGTFLTRLLGNLLPGVREDDLLLILLIFLLSREEGNEDILVILAILLFGK